MKRTPLKRKTRLRSVSPKRAKLSRQYTHLRKQFLAGHPACQAWAVICKHAPESNMPPTCPPSQDVHHKAGRYGGNYLDVSSWLAVSRVAHDWIHRHPSKAREIGLLV